MKKSKNIIIFVLGVVCILVGFFILNQRKGIYQKVEAVITDMQIRYVGDEMTTDVYITYEVDGKIYENIPLQSYDITMKLNKTITVEYDVNDPSHIRTGHSLVAVIVLFVAGGIMVLINLVKLAVIIKGVISSRESKLHGYN